MNLEYKHGLDKKSNKHICYQLDNGLYQSRVFVRPKANVISTDASGVGKSYIHQAFGYLISLIVVRPFNIFIYDLMKAARIINFSSGLSNL